MEDIFNKRIITVPKPEKEVGVDTQDTIINKIADGEKPDGLAKLTTVSLDRDMAYAQIDDMCADSRIASVLEIYTEDATCIGEDGRIVYVDSTDTDVAKMVTHFLDAMNIDKYIYSWAYSLIKYGDVYVRLYHQSETNPQYNLHKQLNESNNLDEALTVQYYNNTVDPYSDYCQQVLNPAEMFELKKFGKTYGYIQCPVTSVKSTSFDRNRLQYQLSFQNNDVKIYQATSFVHGCLNQSVSRVAETVEVFQNNGGTEVSDKYEVNRGQSIFFNVYPIWRQMQLLENAMLLNRINKSAILRIMQVEVGNIPDQEQVNDIVTSVKQMLQEKMSISTSTMAQLYMSEQPTVSYAVMPTKNGAGALSSTEIGGDTGETNLDDIDYFKNKLFSALRVPKALVGETGGDAAGFDAGGSIAQQSYRYGKAVRWIQNVLIQMITDLMNLRLVDRGLDGYIDKFQIKMHFPITQEDTLNQNHKKEQIDLVMRIMDSLEDVIDDSSRLTILRYLIPTVIDDTDVLTAISSELEKNAEMLQQEELSNHLNNDEVEASETRDVTDIEAPEEPPSDLNDFANI